MKERVSDALFYFYENARQGNMWNLIKMENKLITNEAKE